MKNKTKRKTVVIHAWQITSTCIFQTSVCVTNNIHRTINGILRAPRKVAGAR